MGLTPPPGADAPPAPFAALRRHPMLAHLGFAVLYVAALVAGRASRIEASPQALVWPAAAAGLLWLICFWPSRRQVTIAVAGAVLLTGATLMVLQPLSLTTLLSPLGNGAQMLITGWVLQRLQRGRTAWRLRGLNDLYALAAAAIVGSTASALAGPAWLGLLHGVPLLQAISVWSLRNAVDTLLLTAIVLRLADHRGVEGHRTGERATQRRAVEMVVATVLLLGGYAAIFGEQVHLPVAFLLLPLSMWFALRFDTTVSVLHLLPAGALVIVMTMNGRGPFMVEGDTTRVLLAQAYVGVAALVTLMLALQRDETRVLIRGLHRAREDAAEQATLLSTIFETTSDGISVYDVDGVVMLRNAAATAMLAAPPPGLSREKWAEHYRITYPDGTLVATEDMPVARALAGENVDRIDLCVQSPDRPDGLMISMSAHPMPASAGASWSGGVVVAYHDVTEVREAAAETAKALDLLSGVLDAATEQAIVGYDHHGVVMVYNHGAERMLGYRTEEMIGRRADRLYDAAEINARSTELGIDPGFEAVVYPARAGYADSRRWTHLTKSGERLQVMLSVSPLHDTAGHCIGTIGVATDITEQVHAQDRLADSELRFRLAFDTAPVGMMIVGLGAANAGRILQVNTTLSQFSGYSAEDLVSFDMHTLTHPEEREACREDLARVLAGDVRQVQLPRRYQRADGTTRWGVLSASVVDPGHGAAPYLLCLIEDVTARREAELALTHQAMHCGLTGLPNRILFHDRLDHALSAAGRSHESVGVLYLDLDGFKAVNDTAGHAAGDELLCQVSSRLAACLRPGDTIARLGGDEFAVVCPAVQDITSLDGVAQRLLASLRLPVELAAGTFTVGASIGMSITDNVATTVTPEELLARADTAMYTAKRAGKNRAHACLGDSNGPGPLPADMSYPTGSSGSEAHAAAPGQGPEFLALGQCLIA